MGERHVELIEGRFYWIRPAYAETDDWIVARWEHGCFWSVGGGETAARAISGPIEPPAADLGRAALENTDEH